MILLNNTAWTQIGLKSFLKLTLVDYEVMNLQAPVVPSSDSAFNRPDSNTV